MSVMTIMGRLKALVTDEAPPMVPAFHIVTALGFHCLDPAMRAFLEGAVVVVFLEALTYDT